MKIIGMNPNELAAPIYILVEVTNRCNLNCLHCGVDAEWVDDDKIDVKNELSLPDIEDLMNQCAELGVVRVFISGGEPLLREDIFEIISKIRKKSLDCCLSTNGVLIDSQTAGKLKELDINYVEVNLSGPTEKVNDEFFGRPGTFTKIVNAIQLLLSEGIPTKVNVICSKFSFPFLKETIAFLVNSGVDDIFLASVRQAGRTLRNRERLVFSPAEYADFILDIDALIGEFYRKHSKKTRIVYTGTESMLHYLSPSTLLVHCGAARLHCTISSAGNVRPCPYFPDIDSFVVGNIRTKKLQDIWQESSLFRDFRNMSIHECEKCAELNCVGGCSVASYIRYKKIGDGADPYCKQLMIEKIKDSLRRD